MTELKIKVVPNSSRDSIVGKHAEAIKIKVKAPPEKGKANQAVIKLLAKSLGIPVSSVQLISGQTNALKVLQINELSIQEIYTLLDLK